jgi:hypothetical protein
MCCLKVEVGAFDGIINRFFVRDIFVKMEEALGC